MTAFASTPAVFLSALVLVGAGMGTMNPCIVSLVGLFLARELHGRAIGAIQLMGDVAGSLGPIAGSLLLMHATGAPFFVSAVIVICVLPAGFLLDREERIAIAVPAPAEATGRIAAPQS